MQTFFWREKDLTKQWKGGITNKNFQNYTQTLDNEKYVSNEINFPMQLFLFYYYYYYYWGF